MTDAKQPAQFDWATELSDVDAHVTLSAQEAKEIGARLRASHGQAPAGESLRTDALCDLSYSHGLKAGWNYCASDDLSGFERAQKIGTEALRTLKSATAQPAPAAVTGPSKAITASIMRDDGGDHPAFCLMVAYRSQADAEAALELLAAAPTTQPASQQEPVEMPAAIEQMATGRYKVVPSHESMFHRWAVVAGTGAQQLYLGREVECQNMARKFAGAFLDGVYVALRNAAPQPSPGGQNESAYQRGYMDGMAKGRRDVEAAPKQEAQEPVAWQSRTRPTWEGNTSPWSPWKPCTKEQAEDCWKTPLLHEWAYEARALYTAPPPSPAPLSDDLRDRLVAISEAIADQDDRAAQAMLREILEAPQPSPTAQAAESHPAPVQSGLVATMLDALRHAQKVLNHNNLHLACGPVNAAILAARAQAAESVQGDALDAERYAIVRRGQHWSVIDGLGDPLTGDRLDAAVDAARAAQEGK